MMKVMTTIKLSARAVALMHKNCSEDFGEYVVNFMRYYGCSRTRDELLSISTDELLKDMWSLRINPDTFVHVRSIDDSLLHAMLFNLNYCDVAEVSLDNLFCEFVDAKVGRGDWEDV